MNLADGRTDGQKDGRTDNGFKGDNDLLIEWTCRLSTRNGFTTYLAVKKGPLQEVNKFCEPTVSNKSAFQDITEVRLLSNTMVSNLVSYKILVASLIAGILGHPG